VRLIINIGGAGNDILQGGLGNDSIYGGLGDDTVTYTGTRAEYSLTSN
jgi:serralysin